MLQASKNDDLWNSMQFLELIVYVPPLSQEKNFEIYGTQFQLKCLFILIFIFFDRWR